MIEFRLSGGAANTAPAASLGGALSATAVASELASYHGAALPGVSIVAAHANAPDSSGSALSASLYFSITAGGVRELVFAPYGASAGGVAADAQNYANITAGGLHTLSWAATGASLVVAVTPGSLPAIATLCRLDVVRAANALFGDTLTADADAATVDYRCVYLLNGDAQARNVDLYFSRTPASALLAVGFDPAGIGVAAPAVPDALTAPAGVVFGVPLAATPLTVALPATSWVALWCRRQVKLLLPAAVANDYFDLTARVT